MFQKQERMTKEKHMLLSIEEKEFGRRMCFQNLFLEVQLGRTIGRVRFWQKNCQTGGLKL
jgi:hypothetical protein